MYILPITSILGGLQVVRAGDTGTIPFNHRDCCNNGVHHYNHDLARADGPRGMLDAALEVIAQAVTARCGSAVATLLCARRGGCFVVTSRRMCCARMAGRRLEAVEGLVNVEQGLFYQ